MPLQCGKSNFWQEYAAASRGEKRKIKRDVCTNIKSNVEKQNTGIYVRLPIWGLGLKMC